MTHSQRFLMDLRHQYDEQLKYGESFRQRLKEYYEIATEISTCLGGAQLPAERPAKPGPIHRKFTIPIVPYMVNDPSPPGPDSSLGSKIKWNM
jgi:hypothetical protein